MEMLGTATDWMKLTLNLKILRILLETLRNELHICEEWWNVVEDMFQKSLETYQGNPHREWWSHILDYERAYSSGR